MLASAVSIALLGIGFSSPVSSTQLSVSAEAEEGAAGISSVGRYIITFEEAGLLHYNGDLQGFEATAPKSAGTRKLDVQSLASRKYADELAARRDMHVAEIESRLLRKLEIVHTYAITKNGISAALSPAEVAEVAAMPGVLSVKPVREYSPDTFRGPKFIGADAIWTGTGVPNGTGTKGQGIKIGIIDTGTNTTHPSFANDPACGFSAASPKLFAFDCNTSSAGHCTGSQPNAQTSGHGVHTGSTAGGNTIDNSANPSPELPTGVSMSGVAPCATVYSYRVENNTNGALSSDAITAAIESLAADQIDVVNYSIGPGCANGTPWSDEDRMFLDAINADVFVAASAGNTRQECQNDPVGRVSHMGPWMLTVAASTQDQVFLPALNVTGPGTPPANIQSIPIVPGNTTAVPLTTSLSNYPLRTYPANLSGCTDTGGFPANYFTGSIAVVRRGFQAPGTTACGFIEKVNNAKNAGATMVIVANNQNQNVSMDTTGTTIPSFSISTLAESDALIAFVSANLPPAPNADVIFKDGFDPVQAGAVADYKKGVITSEQGDVLGSFSKRGPTPGLYANLTKPDITGPGVDVLAAGRPADGNYFLNSGTSMSSPHLAGAAALVRAARPNWTVAEVKSALQTTAKVEGFQENGTTPWTPDQVGSGRVDLTKAAKAGLTLDETYQRFVNANPNGGSVAIKDLNIASVREMNCQGTCTWKRTVKNQMSTAGTWNVTASGDGFTLAATPATFTLPPGQTQEITITATPGGVLSAIKFGSVTLKEANGQSPDQHITAALKGTNAALPVIAVAPTSLSSTLAANATDTKTLTVSNTGTATLNWNFTTTGTGAIWDQPQSGNSGIVSSYSTVDNGGGFTAADFQVSGTSGIKKIKVFGFDNSTTLAAQPKITWRIYSDASGSPSGNPDTNTGSPVWTFDSSPTGPGVTIENTGIITLDLVAAGQTLSLPAGTYWLTVFPTYANAIGPAGSARWNWFQADQQVSAGKLVGNLFGVANWTALNSLGLAYSDVAFKIEGDITCGASWLSMSPTSGNTAGGGNTPVTVTFNSNGMAPGTYKANACIASNDATKPVVTVPVTMTVQSGGGGDSCPSQILLDPSFEATDSTSFENPSWPSFESAVGTPFCTGPACVTGGTNLARTGNWWAWLGGTSNGTSYNAWVKQDVTIPSGPTPRYLHFWAIRTVPAATATTTLTVSIDNTVLQTYPKPTANDSTYVGYSLPVPAALMDGGVHTVKIDFTKSGSGSTGNVHLDDVTIDCSATATEVPRQPTLDMGLLSGQKSQ